MSTLGGKRLWLTLLKVLVSGGLVYWILRDVELEHIWRAIAESNMPLLIFAFGIFFIGYVITALRWRALMSVHGTRPPLAVLVQSFMVAVFFNNLLPSTIGGDVSRMFDAWRLGVSKTHAVSVVLLDRFIGLLALLVVAGTAVLASREIAVQIPMFGPVIALVIGGAAILAGLVFGHPRILVDTVERLVAYLPGALARLAHKVLDAFHDFRGRTDTLAKAFSLSLLLQLNVIIHFTLVAWAMHIPLSFLAMCVVIPASVVVMMIPVSINAIGLREASFVYFMSFFGVGNAQAVAFAWIAFAFVLFQGLLGGVVFALRRRPVTATVGANRDAVPPRPGDR